MSTPPATDPAPEPPDSPPPERPSRRPGWTSPVLGAALVLGVIGGLAGGWAMSAVRSGSGGGCDAVRVAEQALPAVVTVAARGASGAAGSSGTGSGAVIGADGVIVTNDHVISVAASGGSIAVQLTDGTTKPARLVGRDPKTDLAVLKVDATGLPTLEYGDASALSVGQPVVALGAPLGLSSTVTAGIVSALGRNVPAPTGEGGTTVLVGSIQTDASINPGNSGGPLVDCSARLVGINTAISTVPNEQGVGGGGSVGIGFAVPAPTVQSITEQLQASGRAAHPWLGMSTAPLPAEAAAALGTGAGLFVQSVTPGGPAAAAGLAAGDLITRINGSPATPANLALVLLTSKVGDAVTMEYVRDGAAHTATVTLAEQP